MSDPRHHEVRVRRSPRIGVFLVLGAALGALAALIAVGLSPADPDIPTPQALGFLVLLLAPLGALIAGGVAVLIDRAGERRVRVVQAERVASGPDGEPASPNGGPASQDGEPAPLDEERAPEG